MEWYNPNHQPDKGELKALYVGKQLSELPTPMAVMDKQIVQANAQKMLEACQALAVKFRPHVKTHKTVEATRIQLGPSPASVPIVVSTISELEFLTPLLLEYKQAGAAINVLYSMPLPPSNAPRLATLSSKLGPDSISIMIDNPAQLTALSAFRASSAPPPHLFLKIDVGYHRAGLTPNDPALLPLIDAALAAHANGLCILHGVYSHDSNSYQGTSPADGMSHLTNEITNLKQAAEWVFTRPHAAELLGDRKLVLSVGATPDATSVQNLLGPEATAEDPVAEQLKSLLQPTERAEVELHAGVYPFLDMQQLRTQAVPAARFSDSAEEGSSAEVAGTLGPQDIAFTVLAEICSIYPARTPPQALINVGCLALGREPCLGYSGMGVVSNWDPIAPSRHGLGKSGWAVGKISQEHGILVPEAEAGIEGGKKAEEVDVRAWEIGRKVRVLPNHACIAGAGFGWYVVVDGGERVVDVWVRARGW